MEFFRPKGFSKEQILLERLKQQDKKCRLLLTSWPKTHINQMRGRHFYFVWPKEKNGPIKFRPGRHNLQWIRSLRDEGRKIEQI